MARPFAGEPDKIAYYEKAGWEAYYDRDWPRAFRLLVRLNREAFSMSWFMAVAAALDTVRASIAFAPLVDNDVPKARRYMTGFFKKARRSLGLTTDAQTLTELELDYWIVHRQLALRRQVNQEDDDIEPMVQSLKTLHAALFEADPETMRPSAEYRAMAAKTVDRITGNYSNDIETDWRLVEDYLQKAYRSVKAEVSKSSKFTRR